MIGLAYGLFLFVFFFFCVTVLWILFGFGISAIAVLFNENPILAIVICVVCFGVGFVFLKEFLGIFLPKRLMKFIGLLFMKQKEIVDESDTPKNRLRKRKIMISKIIMVLGLGALGLSLYTFLRHFVFPDQVVMILSQGTDYGKMSTSNPFFFSVILNLVCGLLVFAWGYLYFRWHKSHYGTKEENEKIFKDLTDGKSLNEVSKTDYNREPDVTDEIEEFGQKAMCLHEKINSIVFHEKSYMMQDYRFKENVERLLDLLEEQKEKLKNFERSMENSSEERNQ